MKMPFLKINYSFLFIFCFQIENAQEKIELNGIYLGKNIYVDAGWHNTDTLKNKFCIEKILINNKEFDFEKEGGFEIPLNKMQLDTGDSVHFVLFHSANCRPKIFQEFNHYPKSTFEIVSIEVDSMGLLKWKTKKENSRLAYCIEQFRWNKWVKVGEVSGTGNWNGQEYTFQLIPHSGLNKVRVKQITYHDKPRMSQSVEFTSTVQKVTLKSFRILNILTFSEKTMYEIYDQYGNIVKRGTAQHVDCSKLKRGGYYINFDSEMSEVIKY